MNNDEAIDLLFELREAISEAYDSGKPAHVDVELFNRVVDHTNGYAERSKRRSTGAAHTDRLVSARLNLRASEYQG